MFGEGGNSLGLFSGGPTSSESSLSMFPFTGAPTAPVTPGTSVDEIRPPDTAQHAVVSGLENDYLATGNSSALNLVPTMDAAGVGMINIGPAVSSDEDAGNVLSDEVKGNVANGLGGDTRHPIARNNGEKLDVAASGDVTLDVGEDTGNGIGNGHGNENGVSTGDDTSNYIGVSNAESMEAGIGRVDVG